MSKGILKVGLAIAGVAAMFIPGANLAVASTLGASNAVGSAIVGLVSSAGLQAAQSLIGGAKPPSVMGSVTSTIIDPNAPQPYVMGEGYPPPAAASKIGDTHIGDDGTIYTRVNDGGILLGGSAITLAGYRPQLAWTLADSQPLRDTITQAGQAYTDANDALDGLADLASDGVLSINEKITKLIPDSLRLEDKWSALFSLATSLGVSTTSASSARSAWLSYLSSLSPAWNNTAADTPVVRTAYNSARDTYDAGLYALDQAIKNKATQIATWAGVSGYGKPADNATRNVVTYSATAPASPVDGDLWVDTSGTFAVFKLRSSGGWVTGANALSAYNALSGRPVALSDINTTESSKLAGIAAGATVGAPIGTPVGSIGAGDVSTTIKSGGGVADNQVSTPALLANSVTVFAPSYSDVPVTLTSPASGSFLTFTSLRSTTYTSVGSPVFLLIVLHLRSHSPSAYNLTTLSVRLLNNGTVIKTFPNSYAGTGPVSVVHGFFDVPAAGTVTYSVEAAAWAGVADADILDAAIIPIEIKR